MSFPVGIALRDLVGFAQKLTRTGASLSHFHNLNLFSLSSLPHPPLFFLIQTCVIKKYLRPGAEWAILAISVARDE